LIGGLDMNLLRKFYLWLWLKWSLRGRTMRKKLGHLHERLGKLQEKAIGALGGPKEEKVRQELIFQYNHCAELSRIGNMDIDGIPDDEAVIDLALDTPFAAVLLNIQLLSYRVGYTLQKMEIRELTDWQMTTQTLLENLEEELARVRIGKTPRSDEH